MNELLFNIKGQLIGQIKNSNITRITEEQLKNLIANYRNWQENNRELNETEKNELFIELSSHYAADLNFETDFFVLERGQSLVDMDLRLHEEWSPKIEERFFWRKQREFLMEILTKRDGTLSASKIINSIDFETEAILKNMENPLRANFDSRGLVVGYVQSGKTANFTALASKAADAGYKFIIILAGIHDELRQQTQIRIDKELTGHNNLNLKGSFVEWNEFEENKRWYNLTSAGWLDGKETGEFSGKGINKFKDVFLNKKRPVIAIIKKNVKILERVIKWMSDSDENDRINVPILIIDDEADQASIDGNSNKADIIDPAKTNAKIREIINLFERASYVGYTATPFANVFIKHDTEHDKYGDDLYPRNFIYALPEPQGYFGTKRIFHDDLDKLFVKKLANPKNERIFISNKGEITDDLVESIISFFIGISIRQLRGNIDSPMSMMINIDHRVSQMKIVGSTIEDYVLGTLPKYINKVDIENIYENYIINCKLLNKKLEADNKFFDKDLIINTTIKNIKEKIVKIRILNSSNEDKLDYAKEPDMKVIAIGGNKLSRGLTLEGLMITYYLRESKQFDTLLQMGRWFGYRKNYEDLVRIFTSEKLWKQFKDLAIVELEFRENIREMISEDKRPNEFAIGVKQILGLLPTAQNRLGSAILIDNYGGSQVSVTRLALEKTIEIDNNIKNTFSFLSNIANNYQPIRKNEEFKVTSLIYNNIKSDSILEYLKDYIIAKNEDGSSLDFNKENLIKYIVDQNKIKNLLEWNLGVISLNTNELGDTITLPNKTIIKPVFRARLKTEPVNGAYNIKGISDKMDRRIDLPNDSINEYDNRKCPLLLIYFIDKNSKPREENSSTRLPLYDGIELSKIRNPVSYSIIFPKNEVSKSGTYIQKIN
jgi:hypothetical protein